MSKLTITIVNFNGGDYLINCLRSLDLAKDEAEITIYVIDNNSSDESIALAKKEFPKINYILNKDNLGFGRAHNQALKLIKEGYVLILNPDTIVPKGVISRMVKFMENDPLIGASTCKVLFADGREDLTAHRGFPTPWSSFKYYILKDDSDYHLTNRNLSSVHEVDALSGSFMLTRADILEKVGLFDEDYFMYAEDIDICFRIKEAGFKIMYVPDVFITHFKGVSSGLKNKTKDITSADLETKKRSLNAFYETMLIFYKKHMAKKYPFFVNWMVFLGINLKWVMAKRKLQV